jgi:hypothetical protein
MKICKGTCLCRSKNGTLSAKGAAKRVMSHVNLKFISFLKKS